MRTYGSYSNIRHKLRQDTRSDLPLPSLPINPESLDSTFTVLDNTYTILDASPVVDHHNHIYENPTELIELARISRLSKSDITSPQKKTSRLSACVSKTSTMSSGLSCTDLDQISVHNRTLSSLEGELSGRGSACLSPATKIRLAADGNRVSTSDDDSGCALEAEYVWYPSGLRPDLIHQYFACLPDDKVPLINSLGEKWRVRQLLLQLPPHDCEPRYCRHLPQQDHKELKAFAAQRNRDALGRGTVKSVPYHMDGVKCRGCSGKMAAGDMAVSAARVANNKMWHPGCFSCNVCNELLVDLIYFHKDSKLYCGRHHAESIKPRCSACDEIIFADECTEAEGRSWHMTHFACFECDTQLGGERYVMRQERPYCVPCYQTMFAEVCVHCRGGIGLDQAHVTLEDRQWHTHCFVCSHCTESLQGKPFLPRHGNVYCGVDCCAMASSTASPSTPPSVCSGRRSRSLGRAPGQSRNGVSTLHHANVHSDSDSAPAADSDYETIVSYPKLPPTTSRTAVKQSNYDQRMTTSVVQESSSHKSHSARTRRRRRHRSLTELNNKCDQVACRPARNNKASSRCSVKSHSSHVYEDLNLPDLARSERSYAKALHNTVLPSTSHKIETTFGVDDSSSVTSSSRGANRVRYASPMVTYHTVLPSAHDQSGCSTCSSSSEDEADDYYNMHYNMSLPRNTNVKYTNGNNSLRSKSKPKTNHVNNCIVS